MILKMIFRCFLDDPLLLLLLRVWVVVFYCDFEGICSKLHVIYEILVGNRVILTPARSLPVGCQLLADLWDRLLYVFLRYPAGVVAEPCQILVCCVLLAIYEDFVDFALLYVFYEVFGAVRVFS